MHINISEIKRSRRKSIAVEVRHDASVIVRAPGWVSQKAINNFVESKSGWIIKKQKEAGERVSKLPRRNFAEGEEFFYLGDKYNLRVIDNQDVPLKLDGCFMMSHQHRERAREIFTDWYRDQAARIIVKRAELISGMSGREYKKMKITSARRRWGSCTTKGNINFSLFLVMAPLRVIDYVVAHEISHLSELNHSPKFWHKVGSLMPDFKEQKIWLRENGHLLVI